MSHFTRTPEYRSWHNMMLRCYREDSPFYAIYGGRGIKVCSRWHQARLFVEDMGPKPSLAHTLDRIDNDGDYEPSNCRWSTRKEQARNTRRNHRLTVNGKTKLLVEWCEEKGLNHATVIRRLTRGWSAEEAVLTPGSGKPHCSKRTHCPKGHAYTPENTRTKHIAPGKKERCCRICEREQKRYHRQRKKIVSGNIPFVEAK